MVGVPPMVRVCSILTARQVPQAFTSTSPSARSRTCAQRPAAISVAASVPAAESGARSIAAASPNAISRIRAILSVRGKSSGKDG